jgi:hypothetical protein
MNAATLVRCLISTGNCKASFPRFARATFIASCGASTRRKVPRIRIGERELLNFSSNDYLGWRITRSSKKQPSKPWKSSASAPAHQDSFAVPSRRITTLRRRWPRFKGTEAALTFSSGYATALGTICALVGKDDIIAIDKLVHASIVDAARLSGAKLRVFAHNDLDDLERILKWADQRAAGILPAKQDRQQDAGGTLQRARPQKACSRRHGECVLNGWRSRAPSRYRRVERQVLARG